MARVGGLEPPGPVLETGSVATSLTPSFSKSNKKTRPKPGLVRTARNALRPSRHDSPNDPLRGHSDYVAFEGPKHRFDSFASSTVAQLWSARQDSNLRTLRS